MPTTSQTAAIRSSRGPLAQPVGPEVDHLGRRGTQCAPSGGISARRAISACSSPRKRAQSSRRSSDTKSPGSSGSRAREASGSWLAREIAHHLQAETVDRVVRTQALHVGASSRRLWPRLYGVARAVGSPKRGRRRQFHGKSANFWAAAGALGIGLVGHRVKGALDPIGLGSDPWSVLDPGRMCEDGGVSAHRFDHRDVEQVVSRLVFTAAYDPGVSVTSHTKFVTVWRGRNPLSHPRLFSQLPQQPFGAGVRGRAALPFGSTFRLPRRGRAENPSLCSPLRLQRPDLPLYPAGWMFWLTRKTFSGSKVALISASRS